MYDTKEIRNEFHKETERRLYDGKLLPVANSQTKVLDVRRDYYERTFRAIDDLLMEDIFNVR